MAESKLSYVRVKETLRKMIADLPPGAKILSRPELTKKLDTSRTTVDRAISELIGEGYLYARDGSGTYVTKHIPHKGKSSEALLRNWGVILPDIQLDPFPGILRGIEDEANTGNFNTIICNSDGHDKKQNTYLKKMIHSHVSGIIIVPSIICLEDSILVFREVEKAGIPIVFCNRGVPFIEAPKVFSNNFYGSYIAVKHLLETGYRKIAYITRHWYSHPQERLQGYMAALAEAGITPDESYYTFSPGKDGIMNESTAMDNLLDSDDPPDAVFCFNDSVAENVYWSAVKHGKKPGFDFGIIGYNNTSLCERLPVKLSSIQYKNYEIGREAAMLLKKMINGENVPSSKTVILQPELAIRESSLKSRTL
jgi:DNA-binding LacI/PurR family transcriptional regulator/biotin operon repressor